MRRVISAILILLVGFAQVLPASAEQEMPWFAPIHVSVLPVANTEGYNLETRVYVLSWPDESVGKISFFYPDGSFVESPELTIPAESKSFSFTFSDPSRMSGGFQMLVTLKASNRVYRGSTISYVYQVPKEEEGYVLSWFNPILAKIRDEVLFELSPQIEERFIAVTYANVFAISPAGDELVSTPFNLFKKAGAELNVFDVRGSPMSSGETNIGPVRLRYRLSDYYRLYNADRLLRVDDLEEITQKSVFSGQLEGEFLTANLEEGSGSFYPDFR